jgi:Amt family ammonium transporter
VAYGVTFFSGAESLAQKSGYELTRFFFLLTFAAAIPAIVSGGIAERARFNPQLAATFALVGSVYPFFEGIAWNGRFGIQAWIESTFGASFHDFAGSVVVHAMGGWIGLVAVLLLGARRGRYGKDGEISAHPPSSIPFLALGAWILSVGWFGFNVMSAQTIDKISGLVAANSLMAMAGGTLVALFMSRNRSAHWLPARWPGRCSSTCSRSLRTAGRSTTCWACGRCMEYAAPGAGSPPGSSAPRRWADWGASASARS